MIAKCSFLDILPSELIIGVLQHVPIPDLIRFSRASKRAYEYATDITWRDIVLRDRYHKFPLSTDQIRQLANRASWDEELEDHGTLSQAHEIKEDSNSSHRVLY